jgi:hypothetical protein
LTPIEDSSTTIISTTTATDTLPISSTTITIDDDDDNDEEEEAVIWEDPDLDFVIVEPTTTAIIPIASTTLPISTEILDETDVVDESTTIPLETIEHFDFVDGFPPSSTIAGGIAVAQQESQLNWWDLDDISLTPLTDPNMIPLTTTVTTNTFTLIPSTIKLDEDEWEIFNTSSIPSNTQLEHVSDSNFEIDFDMNDLFSLPTLLTTPTIDVITNNTSSFVPYYFTDYKTKEQLSGLVKPVSTLAMPPFSWMLHLAKQNKTLLHSRQSLINKTRTTTSSTTTTNKKKRAEIKAKMNNNPDQSFEYCNKKQCQHGGRLNSDCLCICLPAFNGDNCEIGTDT